MVGTHRFCSVVKAARKAKGLTLEQVAKAAGTHKGYISGIENDKVGPPRFKVLARMAKILGLPEKRLLCLRLLEHRGRVSVRDIYEHCAELLEAEAKAASDRSAGQALREVDARQSAAAIA